MKPCSRGLREGKRTVTEAQGKEWQREYEKTDERRASKKARREADPDKNLKTVFSLTSRARQREADPEAYLKNLAANQLRLRNRELILTSPDGNISGADLITRMGAVCFDRGDGEDEHPLTVGKMDQDARNKRRL